MIYSLTTSTLNTLPSYEASKVYPALSVAGEVTSTMGVATATGVAGAAVGSASYFDGVVGADIAYSSWKILCLLLTLTRNFRPGGVASMLTSQQYLLPFSTFGPSLLF